MVRFFQSLSPRARGICYVLFPVLVWAGWMVVSSYSVRSTLTAYDISALRFSTASLVLAPLAFKKGLRIGPWGRWGALWLAMMMGASYNTICMFGFKFAPTSHAAIIQTTVLLGSTLGGVLLLHEKFSRLQAGGVVLSVAGIACLLEAGDAVAMPHLLLGHALFILGGIMWACYTVSVRKWQADPLQTTAAVCCMSGLIYVPIYVLFLPKNIGLHNWDQALFQAIYQGVINSVFALLCYNRAVKYLGASASSAFLPLIPVVASLMAMPALGEYPNLLEWAGMALAAVGVLMATGIAGRYFAQHHKLA